MAEIILQQPSTDPLMMHAYAAAGWRAVMLDLEHGYFTERDVANALAALTQQQCRLFVKMSDLEPRQYARFFEMGVRNFILPHLEERSSIIAIQAAMQRVFYLDFGAVQLFPLIESRAAVANLAQICSTPGVAGALIGPGDLAHDLGLHIRTIEDYRALGPQLVPKLSEVLDQIRSCGVRAGCMVTRSWFAGFPFDKADLIIVPVEDLLGPDNLTFK